MPIINNSAPIAPPQNQQLDGQVGPQGRAQQGNQARNLGLHLGEVPDALQNARPSTARIIGRVVAGIFTLGISEGIRAIVNHVRSGSAENRPVLPGAVPHAQVNVDQANNALASSLSQGGMPEAHLAALKEGLDELRAQFGDRAVPPFNGPEDFEAFNEKTFLYSLVVSIQKCPEEVTPGKLKLLTLDFKKTVVTMAMRQCYEEYGKDHNYEDINSLARVGVDFREGSDRYTQLHACTNMGEVKNLFESLEDVHARLERDNELNVYARDGMQSLQSQISQKTGIPKDLVPDIIDLSKFESKHKLLSHEFLQNPLPQPQMKATYTKLVNTILTEKMNALDILNTIDTSQELKTILQNELLKSTFLKGDMLRATLNDGSSVDTTSLAQFLRTEKPDATTIAQFLSSLGIQILENREAHMNFEEWQALGAEGQLNVRLTSTRALFHSNPELLAALRSLPNDMLEEVSEIFSQQFIAAEHMRHDDPIKATTMQVISENLCMMDAISITTTSTELADTLVTQEVGPAYAGAIGTAIIRLREQNGPSSLPPGYISQWTHLSEMVQPLEDLKNQIRELKETPSPEEVARLFTTIMQQARNSGAFPYLFD